MASIPRFNVSRTNKEATANGTSYNDGQRVTNHDGTNSLGFGNIPEQMHRKAVKKGFNFTIMVVGESGLGKSTFINTLLMTEDLYKDREVQKAADNVVVTTKIVKRFIELDEKGVKLRLTILDTPGFNDAVNSENCWTPIEDYIDGAFEHYFKEECGLNRKNIQDNRVHCCLYFISPIGRGLRPVDIHCIKRLQHRVNVVPVIAKADCLTSAELARLKQAILSDIERHHLEVYRLPECDSDEEESIRRLDREIKLCLPFSVIGAVNPSVSNSSNNSSSSNSSMGNSTSGGSNTSTSNTSNTISNNNNPVSKLGGLNQGISSSCNNEISNSNIRGRKYPWGTAEVGSDKHCDFNKLRVFLLKTHMQDLKDMTSDVLYENYRARCITERMSRRQTERQSTPGLDGGQGTPRMTMGMTSISSQSGRPSLGSLAGGNGTSNDSRAEIITEPGFEAIVDPENLLRSKDKEIQQMRQLCEQLQSQLQASPQQQHHHQQQQQQSSA